MQKFIIATLGCKVNQCESQLLREQLVSLGLCEAASGEAAGLCIVNTCAVTATAQSKSVRALRKLKKEHPGAIHAALGCGVTASSSAYSEADIVLLQKDKGDTVNRILGRTSEVRTTSGFYNHVRAFIKIQDGCDSFCSYCIVPYLRGKPRSKPPGQLKEARAIAENGYKELVLSGIHLGLYGCDLGEEADLAGVVETLLEAGFFPRLRLSGVELNEVSDRLIRLLAQDNALCPHLHIPLQSGSAKVLKDMNRRYTPAEYLGVITKLREQLPQIAITTDVIVGFPTETESDFRDTMEACRRAGFSRMHIFPYSRREGTAAAEQWGCAAAGNTAERSEMMRNLGSELAEKYARQFTGQSVRVLVESRRCADMAEGYTDHYLRARIPLEKSGIGELVEGYVESSDAGILSVQLSPTTCERNK